MLKIIACIIIIICSYLVGFVFCRMYESRIKELEAFENMLNYFYNQISYVMTPLPEVVNEIKKKMKYPISNFLEKFEYNLSLNTMSALDAWNDSFKKSFKDLNLNNEDKEIIIWFGNGLGVTDKETQLKNIELTINKLKFQKEGAKKNFEKNSKMYKSLGLAIGMFISIMII